ncbi:CLUMA_CG011679, isoform A [Clunio marinus]|uniref:CLUMA_CG011679, isoform A n=1 Tax=Clunio marinus TaxID=568069 RepID=A0A1J1IDH2_9DIPT|nr:CLUMA_CG011679, isoform A [Clunio marinus]
MGVDHGVKLLARRINKFTYSSEISKFDISVGEFSVIPKTDILFPSQTFEHLKNISWCLRRMELILKVTIE